MAKKKTLRELVNDFVKNNTTIRTNIGDIVINPKILGEGGTALVYSSKDEQFAIKFLIEDVSEKESQVFKRFYQEFINLSKLSKIESKIVQIYDFGYISFSLQENNSEITYKVPFYLMKKYRYSLKEYCKNTEVKDISQLDSYFYKIIEIVSIIHSNGIVHRDLKPDNIFIDEYENFVLGDFGIAWFDEKLYEKKAKTQKDDRLANYGFSAPEQFEKNSKPKPTMDIFAIGQLLQWFITRKTIKGIGTTKISEVIGYEAFYYDRIIEKLVQENPLNRPQNIEELKDLSNSERQDSYHNWLVSCNENYRNLVQFINQWKNEQIIPNGNQAEKILVELQDKPLPPNNFIFLIVTIFYGLEESDYLDYSVEIDIEKFINFEGEDIFDTFEVSFSRLGHQEDVSFVFNYFKGSKYKAKTDKFDIYYYFDDYKRKKRFECFYSEIQSDNDNYILLIWNDKNLTYRLKKAK